MCVVLSKRKLCLSLPPLPSDAIRVSELIICYNCRGTAAGQFCGHLYKFAETAEAAAETEAAAQPWRVHTELAYLIESENLECVS